MLLMYYILQRHFMVAEMVFLQQKHQGTLMF